MNELISVIIPVYNVEQYLEECFESVSKQTYNNIEIILVDDGSTDTSGDICDALKTYDSRTIVVHKNNGGLSSARNVGLDMATGKYVAFVDSDDIVDANFVLTLYNTLKLHDTDISSCGVFSFHDHDFTMKKPFLGCESGALTNTQYVSKVLSHKIDNAVWNKLFSRKLIGSLRFKGGIINEDFPFIMSIMSRVSHIAFTDKRMYFYRQREGSITKKLHPRFMDYMGNAIWFKKELASKFEGLNMRLVDSYINQEKIGLLGVLVKYGCPKDFSQEYCSILGNLSDQFWDIIFDSNIDFKQKVKFMLIKFWPTLIE